MDTLQRKHINVSRGLHYRYFTTTTSHPVSPTTPALLLTHGFPDDAQLWQFIVPHLLPTNLKLIIPDLLGYGGTSKPLDPSFFEISAMCQDVVEILAQEGITSSSGNCVVPIGHDWGGWYAQRFYMFHPSLCAGLVTMSVAILPPSSEPFDLDAVNEGTRRSLGCPIYEYWYLFLPHEGVELIHKRMEAFWHVLHGAGREWMKEMFCTKDGMRKFLEEDRRVPLRTYAQDEKLKAQWMRSHDPNQGGSGLLSPTNWYRALAENVHLEAEKGLSPVVEKPYLFLGLLQDFVNRADAIEGNKRSGWCKDLTERNIDSGHWVPYEKPDEVGKAIVEWLGTKGFVKTQAKV